MFGIKCYDDLMILHRAVMEAKFSDDPKDTSLIGSPVLASISHEIVDSLIEHSKKIKDDSLLEHWERWRDASTRTIELEVIRSHIYGLKIWDKWSSKEKRYYLEILLKPFIYDEIFLANLTAELSSEKRHK